MKTNAYVTGIYAILLLVGGVMGFAKTGSSISLISGAISSIILFISTGLMLKHHPWGHKIATGATSLLILLFGYRYLLTHKFMPAGLMIIISAIVLWTLLKNYSKK
jgi:uncharacterized membrane protein (UPF0136 family)